MPTIFFSWELFIRIQLPIYEYDIVKYSIFTFWSPHAMTLLKKLKSKNTLRLYLANSVLNYLKVACTMFASKIQKTSGVVKK